MEDSRVLRFGGVRMVARSVGAGLRLERSAQRSHRRAQTTEHPGKHVVGRDAQPSRSDLRRRVPIA